MSLISKSIIQMMLKKEKLSKISLVVKKAWTKLIYQKVTTRTVKLNLIMTAKKRWIAKVRCLTTMMRKVNKNLKEKPYLKLKL